jgi:hypothetical protein
MGAGVAVQSVWTPLGLSASYCRQGDWRSAGSGKIVPDLAREFAGRKGAGAGEGRTLRPTSCTLHSGSPAP